MSYSEIVFVMRSKSPKYSPEKSLFFISPEESSKIILPSLIIKILLHLEFLVTMKLLGVKVISAKLFARIVI